LEMLNNLSNKRKMKMYENIYRLNIRHTVDTNKKHIIIGKRSSQEA